MNNDDRLRIDGQPDEVEPRLSPDTDEHLHSDTPTREIDGEERLDPDADDDRVDSAEADRLAAGAPEDDDPIPPAPSPLT